MDTKDTNPKDAVGTKKVPRSTVSARVVAEVGLAMLEGALKYGRHNYRDAGVRYSVYYDAVGRHLDAWWEGEDIDAASGLSHVTKAIAGLIVLRDSMMHGNAVDDRPPACAPGWVEEMNLKAAALIERYPNPKPAHLNVKPIPSESAPSVDRFTPPMVWTCPSEYCRGWNRPAPLGHLCDECKALAQVTCDPSLRYG